MQGIQTTMRTGLRDSLPESASAHVSVHMYYTLFPLNKHFHLFYCFLSL